GVAIPTFLRMFTEPFLARGHVDILMVHSVHHHFGLHGAGDRHPVLHDRIVLALDLHSAAGPEIVFAAHVALDDAAGRGLAAHVEIKLDIRPFVAADDVVAGPRISGAGLMGRARRSGLSGRTDKDGAKPTDRERMSHPYSPKHNEIRPGELNSLWRRAQAVQPLSHAHSQYR